MSVNYYLRTPDTPDHDEGVHLGKYVHGEPFHFRGHPDRGVTDYQSWWELARTGQIFSEAGTEIPLDDLTDSIDHARCFSKYRRSTPYRDQHDDANGNRFTDVEFC